MQLNFRYTLQITEQISDAGVIAILKLVQENYPPMPSDWDWTWLTREGKLPKRIASHYFKTHSIKLPAELVAQIGNIARGNLVPGESYSFDFTAAIDWEEGDFGDDGSCYWGDRSAARDMLMDNGAIAIRFWENDFGMGRAWLFDTGDFWVLWNGYGFDGDATLTIALVFSKFMNLTYKRIYLANRHTTSGTLYINSARGYVIGTAQKIENITRYDFDWEDYHGCYNCGRAINQDDEYYGADGEIYCERCYYDRFDSCYRCGETHYMEDLTIAEDELICEYCLNHHYSLCPRCNEYHRAEICPDCGK